MHASTCITHACIIIFVGEFGTVFRGIWKEQPKKQVAVAVKTLKVSIYTFLDIIMWLQWLIMCIYAHASTYVVLHQLVSSQVPIFKAVGLSWFNGLKPDMSSCMALWEKPPIPTISIPNCSSYWSCSLEYWPWHSYRIHNAICSTTKGYSVHAWMRATHFENCLLVTFSSCIIIIKRVHAVPEIILILAWEQLHHDATGKLLCGWLWRGRCLLRFTVSRCTVWEHTLFM